MKSLLIIEDDSVLRENIAELLELQHYRVFQAADGSKGIDLAIKHQPDLIICDIMMPELDGYGVLERLSSDPTTQAIPFIFLSAKTEKKEVRKGMDLGADDYLTKPFEEEDLLHAIESRIAKMDLLRSEFSHRLNQHEDIITLDELKNFFFEEGTILSYKEGEVIYFEENHANQIFLIERGMVKTHKTDSHGKELITKVFREDDFFGYTSFSHQSTYEENATAISETTVFAYSKQALHDILEKNIHLTLELFDFISEDLSESRDRLLRMAYGSVRKKTAATILQFMDVFERNNRKGFRISRADLASVAGITPESFIRTMAEFKQEKLIVIEDRYIRIIDTEGLRKII
ncbi:response regulator [Robertkochia solimangrovi]|uniref:response regulator n=1 Tax=Robertkochia solimangrovi TaxID=2213046 RepID=UPI00117CE86C|nr:response regulator [Robertkochia solimangrovi]TRZ41258.1 transcriptional regulator [Robertkochia solimangrovi]